jgi:hypothetical protein
MAHRGYDFFRDRLPETFIVFLRHGFASKNQLEPAIRGSDFACVSSPWLRDTFTERGLRPRLAYWTTGFVPMDPVLRPAPSSASRLLPESFSGGRCTLLYAPTFNQTLSSAEVLGDDWIDRVRRVVPDLNVIIKPHPHIPHLHGAWMEMWRRAASRMERVHLVEDTQKSIYDYFRLADLMVSDASSVPFYFLAMDRPIVFVRNPQCDHDPACRDPEGPEWAWRDVGLDIGSVDELPAAVLRCLEAPEEKAERRAFYRERVFGDLMDGRAAERIAGRIRGLLRPGPDDREWSDMAWNSLLSRAAETRAFRATLTFKCMRSVNRFPKLASAMVRSAHFIHRIGRG